jgi:hypothetical protein
MDLYIYQPPGSQEWLSCEAAATLFAKSLPARVTFLVHQYSRRGGTREVHFQAPLPKKHRQGGQRIIKSHLLVSRKNSEKASLMRLSFPEPRTILSLMAITPDTKERICSNQASLQAKS